MPLSRWETTSEPFSTTEPTEITERGALVRVLGKEVWMKIWVVTIFFKKSRIDVLYTRKVDKCRSLVLSNLSVSYLGVTPLSVMGPLPHYR
jgi:hypothetical protein